jgi:response regulator RpfG family c-di-GMP phosphodiesterase
MNDKPKILYVDDEEINLQLLEINLKQHYEVITSDNASEGLEILKNNQEIKLVACDMKMPMMNGIEFIKKAKEKYPHLPFFLLTGFDTTPQIDEAVNSQLIIKHLKKPFDIAEMHAVFSKTIAS